MTLTDLESADTLGDIAGIIRQCRDCSLGELRTNAVPGVGSDQASVLFVGEAPGLKEDQQGVPFVGSAGNLLNTMLDRAGISRESVFITNTIKCRPPNNRDPEQIEIDACKKYLRTQIVKLNPKVVVTLGRFALEYFFPGERISRVHGTPRQLGDRTYLPLYHPAAALHNPGLRDTLLEDFLTIAKLINPPGIVGMPDGFEGLSVKPRPKQLDLFQAD